MARVHKGINFGKGVTCTFANFKKGFAGHFKMHKFSEKDIKDAFEVASIEVKTETIKDVKTPANRKRKKANTKTSKK